MFEKKNLGSGFSATTILIITAVLIFVSAQSYLEMRTPDPDVDRVVPANGFARKKLSDYFDGLKETPADTDVFIQQGEEPGGTVLILGGTHANEPASTLAAVLFLENTRINQGRMIVVPFANIMGRTHTYPQDGHPQIYHIKKEGSKSRIFRFGARVTNPVHQWPNPDIYIHPGSGQTMAGVERSNLNRAHPGRPDGCITEKLAYGFLKLIQKEKVDLAIDLHEASPEYPVVNAMVAHERAMELAAIVTMELETQNISIRLEPSPKQLHGLTHREWGDHTDALAVLLETANPAMGRLRGRTDEELILTGTDKAYRKAFDLGQLYIPYEDGTEPIAERVARHVAVVKELAFNLEMVREGKGIDLEGVPDYDKIVDLGVGAFLAD